MALNLSSCSTPFKNSGRDTIQGIETWRGKRDRRSEVLGNQTRNTNLSFFSVAPAALLHSVVCMAENKLFISSEPPDCCIVILAHISGPIFFFSSREELFSMCIYSRSAAGMFFYFSRKRKSEIRELVGTLATEHHEDVSVAKGEEEICWIRWVFTERSVENSHVVQWFHLTPV